MATNRPVVSVFSHEVPDKGIPKVVKSVKAPQVVSAPLRPDIVRFVHSGVAKNSRQAHGVKYEAGYDTAAISWGTGRAVARIPRVPGGGTHRSGQGAFGNMCRGGGMFAPLKTWRRWHRKVNLTQKRHAMTSAIAASSLPALVMARGHHISEVPELPLVISTGVESITKTRQARALLESLGAKEDMDKVIDSKKLRAGKGKMRNRRHRQRKGPLVIYETDNGITRAVRNLPGVESCNVDYLNILQFAPGGNFGRFVIWTEGAFAKLNKIFGTYNGGSVLKKGYTMPRAMMQNADLQRIINSDEIQAVVNVAKEGAKRAIKQKNPITNLSVRGRLRPGYNKEIKKRARAHIKGSKEHTLIQAKKAKTAAKKKEFRDRARAWYKNECSYFAPKVVKPEKDE